MNEWINEFLEKYHQKLAMEGIEVILRPHPNESFRYFENLSNKYPQIVQFQEPSVKSSYNALLNADVVLSGTSMCLYEAVAFGKVSVSLERFRGMTVPDHIRFINSVKELLNLLLEKKAHDDSEFPIKEYLTGFREEVLKAFV